MAPSFLNPDQKEIRMNICADILQNVENGLNLLENIITCDESWFFQYDPESKRQSMHWKRPSSPRQKKARQSKSKFEAMIVFFDIRGIVHVDWVPEGQTVNQVYYKEAVTNLHERVRRKKTWNVEEWLVGSSPRQRAGTQLPVCQVVFDEAQEHSVGTSTVLTWPSPMWHFYFQRQSLR